MTALAIPTTPATTAWATVGEFFEYSTDGWFYPRQPGIPLVRILVAGNEYRVERRRRDGAPWMPIVDAPLVEFDAGIFRVWATGWQLVA